MKFQIDMKVRFFHTAFVALMLLMPMTAMGYDFEVDGKYYKINDNNISVSITYKTADQHGEYSGDVVIPASVTHDGINYPVTAIGNSAFFYCNGMTSVSIPNSVTSIGDYAFYGCTNLAKIIIPDPVTSIGNYAFEHCYGLTEMVIPDAVTTIGDAPFLDCPRLESVVLGSSVNTIGGFLFCNCSQLTSVTSLATAPPVISTSEPFTGELFDNMNYYGHATLHVPSEAVQSYQSVSYWNKFSQIVGDAPGSINENGYNFAVVDGIYYKIENGQATVTNNGQTGCYSGDVVIPDVVTYQGISYPVVAIGDSAFKNCTALTSITPANSIATIGISAFENCTSLTSITIPESVTLIYSPAFDGCTGVKTLFFNAINYQYTLSFRKLPIETLVLGEHVQQVPACLMGHSKQLTSVIFSNSLTTIDVGAFQNCTALTQLNFPPSLTTIEGYAFDGCTGLTSLTIPNSVTKIADNAFSSCNGLSDISFGNSVTTIGNYAFDGCSGLTTVNLPNSVTTIGKYAFKGCRELTSVAMGSNVTSIGNMMVFSGCDKLTSLTCLAAEPPTIGSEGNILVNRYYEHTTVHVLPGLVDAYQSAAYWHLFSQILGDATGSISEDGQDFVVDGIYYHVEDGQATVTNNGQTGCYSGVVVIPDIVTFQGIGYPVVAVGDSAFKNSTALTSITLGDSITTIGAAAFMGCSGLTSITIPEAVTSIGSYSFDGCTSIRSLFFNPVYFPYDLSSFHDCPVETLVFGEQVQRIPGSIMYNHAMLKSVTIPNSVTFIGGFAFQQCTGLTHVDLPSSLVTIDFRAFDGCTGLTSLTIPNAVTSIGDGAFMNCTALDSVIIGNAVTEIKDYAFDGCSGMKYLVFGNSVTTIGKEAFSGCAGLTTVALPHSVTTIGDYAFLNCSGLVNATIGRAVTTIGNVMFCYCNQLTDIACFATIPPTFLYAGLFSSSSHYARATLHVLPDCVEAYQSAEYWKDFYQILGDVPGGISYDVNGDGEINIADTNNVIEVVIRGGNSGHTRVPNPDGGGWIDLTDINRDGEVNIADVNAMIDIILNQ